MIRNVTIIRGIPGSGKSYFSEYLAMEHGGLDKHVFINRDGLREMFGKYWVEGRLDFERSMYEALIKEAVKQDKYNIIIEGVHTDNDSIMNVLEAINEADPNTVVTIATMYSDFHGCWHRNIKRPTHRQVPYKHMMDMYSRFIKNEKNNPEIPTLPFGEGGVIVCNSYIVNNPPETSAVMLKEEALGMIEGKYYECKLKGDKCEIVNEY